MIMLKSQIQHVIDSAVEKTEKNKDKSWSEILKNELEKKESEMILDLNCKESEIKMLNREIAVLKKKLKLSDETYYAGRSLIKKAKYFLLSIQEEHKLVLEANLSQNQRFLTLTKELEDESEKNLIVIDVIK